MRSMLVVLMAICLISSVAIANEKPVHGPTMDVPPALEGSRAVGDDCTDPIVVSLPADMPYSNDNYTCGRGNTYTETCLGSYDGGEDVIYQLDVTAEVVVNINLITATTWTGLGIGTSCPLGDPCMDYVTGSGGNKTLGPLTLTPGTYYVMADTWPSPDCIDAFTLTIDTPPLPPENDTCEGAIDLQVQGLAEFEIDLCAFANEYSPTLSDCTGYSANGPDAIYKIDMLVGESLNVCMAPSDAFVDCSIYLVTDCADIDGTCVAGDDSGNPECIDYTADADGTFYLIVDTYSGCNLVTVTIDNPVANDETTWGTVKSLYR